MLSRRITTSRLCSTSRFARFDRHLGDHHMSLGGFIEGRTDNLGLYGTLHVGHLFGPLIDEQHDEKGLGMIVQNTHWRYSSAARFYPCEAARR